MIPDSDKNVVYLAKHLSKQCPVFFNELVKILVANMVQVELVLDFKNIWCRDYMPIQVKDRFVNFIYDPAYLKSYEDEFTKRSALTIFKNACLDKVVDNCSCIKLEGGNIINCVNKVIMTDKVFSDNPMFDRDELIFILKSLLKVSEIIIIPGQPYDKLGHADGMVRFLDEDTVLLNDYSDQSLYYTNKLTAAFNRANLTVRYFPFEEVVGQRCDDARGCYINFLQLKDLVILPAFGIKLDKDAYRIAKKYFNNVVQLDSTEVAKFGGVINCCTWTVRRES